MKEKLIDLTKQLVRIPSVSSDLEQLEKIVAFVASLFVDYDTAVIEICRHNEKPSLVVQNFQGTHADIVLSGHLDVVPPSEENQFEPYEQDGKLYGRGCSDMKDGCAILIMLMQEILSIGVDKNIALRLTTDEEVGGDDGVGALLKSGRSTDIVLIPDSGSVKDITIMAKGMINVEIEVRGVSAHSSQPRNGTNALEKAYALYQDIKQTLEEPKALYEQDDHRGTSVQMTLLSGGTAKNVIPGSATMTINIRHTPTYTQAHICEEVERIVQSYESTIVSLHETPLTHTSGDHPMVQKFKAVAEEVLGKEVILYKAHGATDGRFFPDETAVIAYQPTDNHIHSVGEYTVIDEVEKVYEVYRKFVLVDR